MTAPVCPKCGIIASDMRCLHRWVGCRNCGWEAVVTDEEIIALALQKAAKPAEQPKSRSQLKRENVMAGRPIDEGVYEPKQPAPLTPEERFTALSLRRSLQNGTSLCWEWFESAGLLNWSDGYELTERGQSLIDRLNAEESKA